MNGSPKLRFDVVSKRYAREGAPIDAVSEVSFSVRPSEFACLVGPSGCGKSTLLHLAAGFLRPSSGRVILDDREVAGPGVDRGVVFQQHGLFPWETAAENVAFGPRMRGAAKAERARVVERCLRDVGLLGAAASYPGQLSVGMQQRVGLARAFANDPEMLLMDEPFGALDALTRLQMQELLLSIWEKHQKTVLFVTHDVEEALLLADRVVVLSAGPARVIRDLPVELPRPRRRGQLSDPAWVRIKDDILAQLGASQPPPKA